MKTCTYISGPPCVGKSTVAKAVLQSIPEIEYIRGDDYWIKHPGIPFMERAALVNQSILASLRVSSSQHVLCEWVPSQGEFLTQLHDMCISADRRFLHVILTAPLSILRMRKRERDGDEDLGPGIATIADEPKEYESRIFSTDQEKPSRIAEEIVKWIRDNSQAG